MFKGRKHSPESRAKISAGTKGQVAWNKGKSFSQIIKDKMSLGHKNSPSSNKGKRMSEEQKLKISLAKKGKKLPPRTKEHRAKFSGSNNHNWKGGISEVNHKIRTSLEYKLWRMAVFARDEYTCIWGGKAHGKRLQADHIKPFAFFPELRFAIDNGRTLCESCHRKTDTYGNTLSLRP